MEQPDQGIKYDIEKIAEEYGLPSAGIRIEILGSGLINDTWKLVLPGKAYILQRLNHAIFSSPELIDNNIRLVTGHLRQHHPDYLFIAPLPAITGDTLISLPGKRYYRLFSFIEGSYTIPTVSKAGEAYEAAQQFGRFTRLLADFDVSRMSVHLPRFHDLAWRYAQLEEAVRNAGAQRKKEASVWIRKAVQHGNIVSSFRELNASHAFRLRVTHHDTKISNVLFDAGHRAIAVIDLDTIMPGYFISDLGDMLRTYLSPAGEEEADLDKIEIRDGFFEAVSDGYSSGMKEELTAAERAHFFYAGQFMTYMQAIRFLTDYLTGDHYYHTTYPGQNLVRAGNQFTLLDRLEERKTTYTRC